MDTPNYIHVHIYTAVYSSQHIKVPYNKEIIQLFTKKN